MNGEMTTMSLGERLIGELTREAATTRRVLQVVPEDKLNWRPHPRSSTLGELAMHVALLPLAITDLVSVPVRELPMAPRPVASSVEELLATLDRSIAFATEKLWEWGDQGLEAQWKLVRDGHTLVELPRVGALRTILLNHWYHHRGQLTVYLRLLDVPLPSVYGPTADENPFG